MIFWCVFAPLWLNGLTGTKKLTRKGATATPLEGPESLCGIGVNKTLEAFRKEEDRRKDKLWTGVRKFRHCKGTLGIQNRDIYKVCIKLSKNKLRMLVGFLMDTVNSEDISAKWALQKTISVDSARSKQKLQYTL